MIEVEKGASSVRAVVMECPEGCGATFTLPAEMLSCVPASAGQVVFTVRMDANNDEGARMTGHLGLHWGML